VSRSFWILAILSLSCAKSHGELGDYACTDDQQCLDEDTCVPTNSCKPIFSVKKGDPCIPGATQCGYSFDHMFCLGGQLTGILETINVPYTCITTGTKCLAKFPGGDCPPDPDPFSLSCGSPEMQVIAHSPCAAGSAVGCPAGQACFADDGSCAPNCSTSGNCAASALVLCLPPGTQSP
jgi:hypothetical protein